jgi:hydroxyacylglutathione hydrolase
MKVEQIYTGCLAQGAYYIQSGNEAAIIDPLREIKPYVEKAKKEGAEIKYVFETHFHADFVSGHLDLSRVTGAPIVYGPQAKPSFECIIAEDGQEFKVGDVTIRAIHTPGHTFESTTYLLLDENGKEYCIFSGDTLFIGDVGRPDLAQKSDITMNDLAGMLYDSLRNKIMNLPQSLLVYPAHGAGSACGKNMSKETFSTLGHQLEHNYALRREMTREEFIHEVTDGLLPPPVYFPENVRMNKEGYESIDTVLKRGVHGLSPDAFEAAANETGALMLDTRTPQTFAKGFIPNAINIGIDGNFAPWVGALITDIRQQILLITDPGREVEVVTRMARVGYDNCIGFLEGGFDAWKQSGKETDHINTISAEEFAKRFNAGKIEVADVRKPGEWEAEHVEGVTNIPLDFISEHMSEFSREKPTYIHCAGGYRSMIAASILKSRGFDNIIEVAGGYTAIAKTDVPRTNFTCASTKPKD